MINDQITLTRRNALKGAAGASLIAMLPACRMQVAPDLSPDEMLDRVAYNLLAHEPERATGLGVDTGDYASLRSQLTDKSPDGQAAYAAQLEADLEDIRAYPRDGMTADQLTGFDVVESAYSTALEGFALPYGDVAVGSWRNTPYVVIQNVGSYIDMPRFMDFSHPMNEPSDVDAYAARIEGFPAQLDGELTRIQQARSHGLIPPDFLLDKAITQMEQAVALAETTYLGPLVRSEVETAQTQIEPVRGLVTDGVIPALQRQLDELNSMRTQAGSDAGMWAQPDGDEWYAWSLKASTTTDMTPDQIHEQGLAELDDLHGRMDPILKEIGYTQGSVGERMQALSEDPRYKFAPGDPGREEIFAFIDERIDWIKAQMPRAFNTLVDPNMEVRRIPVGEELGAPGAYGGAGSKDGTIPGRFWINLRTTDLHRKYDLPDLTFHESIPGHVWEGEYSNRLPLIRSILAFGAFSEGWALYGEQLADELGAYGEFKVGRLGYLQSLAFRACRLVVDTGLHAKRWTREEARRFFVERNGSKEEEVASEVDRYCSWAGQACSYKIGHSEIVRQRSRAQAALGDAYDFKAFNDAVILGGNAPLDVLAKNVDRFIEGVSS
ncbi:DUF885 domain-containing protein [Altererythrobacter sp.]|uniref:DUF885 domain-containing protein n=1 Tax=Altererythrobacter sp. TaxID=1872480 RepID=UPI001B08CE49|nr:DUF885 domain-containing protein [Altererythrobacter sp.]MBO6608905.1 DUF885 domain-containing protein [Altererythrobacter sp.]MBO6640945.1 DUF885 domain-containing protein [Altererythrobacter sp.]MBO6708357.1 DUF885 domain-containing protein [Altererythrobacter sp.]MBO6945506.1 DUF885 domain-containing protein [Altererythrobacter sp.]